MRTARPKHNLEMYSRANFEPVARGVLSKHILLGADVDARVGDTALVHEWTSDKKLTGYQCVIEVIALRPSKEFPRKSIADFKLLWSNLPPVEPWGNRGLWFEVLAECIFTNDYLP